MPDFSSFTTARAALANPGLAPADLAQIAVAQPRLWPAIARHPMVYPELLDWMAQYGNDNVRRAVERRRHADAAAAAKHPAPHTPTMSGPATVVPATSAPTAPDTTQPTSGVPAPGNPVEPTTVTSGVPTPVTSPIGQWPTSSGATTDNSVAGGSNPAARWPLTGETTSTINNSLTTDTTSTTGTTSATGTVDTNDTSADSTLDVPTLPTTQPTSGVPDPQHKLRKDTVQLMWVYPVSLVTIQIVVPIIFLTALLASAPRFLNRLYSSGPGTPTTNEMLGAMGPLLGWMSIVSLVGGACWYFVVRRRHLVTTDLTDTVPVGQRYRVLIAALVVVFAVQGVTTLADMLGKLAGINLSGDMNSLITPYFSSVGGVLYVVLLGPFLEELIFRGAVLRHLAPYGANFAIVTQALLFGIYHLYLFQGCFAFLIGLVFGYVALNFSLKWSLALHVINNTLAYLTGLSPVFGETFDILTFVAIAAVVFLVVRFRRQNQLILEAGRPLAVAHPFRIAWSHPLFIVIAALGIIVSALLMAVAT